MEEPQIHLRRDKQIRPHDKRRHAPPFWQADRPYLHEHHISDARFRRLGYIMAMLAGAINAGGFFAFSRYTSHVTGSMSMLADAVQLREWIRAIGIWGYHQTGHHFALLFALVLFVSRRAESVGYDARFKLKYMLIS